MIAKYLATSLAIENVVSAPRVISSCLPMPTISISLVGLESRSTMFPASFAACVPEFIATPTSACASAGASLVPSPVIATSFPSRLLPADEIHLVLGRGLGKKVVHAGLARNRRRCQWIVAGNHHRANSHRPAAGRSARAFRPSRCLSVRSLPARRAAAPPPPAECCRRAQCHPPVPAPPAQTLPSSPARNARWRPPSPCGSGSRSNSRRTSWSGP